MKGTGNNETGGDPWAALGWTLGQPARNKMTEGLFSERRAVRKRFLFWTVAEGACNARTASPTHKPIQRKQTSSVQPASQHSSSAPQEPPMQSNTLAAVTPREHTPAQSLIHEGAVQAVIRNQPCISTKPTPAHKPPRQCNAHATTCSLTLVLAPGINHIAHPAKRTHTAGDS